MDHVVEVPSHKMDAKAGAQAKNDERRGRPPNLETYQDAQSSEKMDKDRNPNRDIGNWYVDVRKILCRPARVAQLEEAVPDK
jgi:hypothetical protein